MTIKEKNLLNIFGNLKSGSRHFFKIGFKNKNKFKFLEDL